MAEFELKKYPPRIMFERILWNILWTITIRPFPRNFPQKWEFFLLRLFGAKIGKGCTIYSSTRIFLPRNLIMDNGSTIADHVIITNSRLFHVKEKAIISQYSFVYCGTHNIYDESFASEGGDIILEEGCWVAAHCYIGGGVTIGRGARVGADSAVRKSVPPYSVSFGNPNRIVGFCHTPSEIIELEKTKYPENQRLSIEFLKNNYNSYFLKRLEEIKNYIK